MKGYRRMASFGKYFQIDYNYFSSETFFMN